MGRQSRILIAIGSLELLVIGLWIYLERLARLRPEQIAPDFHRTLGSTLGSVMGFILGFGVILLLMARRSDRHSGGR